MKTYAGFSRDHSASMRGFAEAARKDFNNTTNAVREATIREGQDTIVAVVECGAGHTSSVRRAVVNSSIGALKALQSYETNGSGTPLFDSVGDLIEQFEQMPDAGDPTVAFLLNVTTDGYENASKKWDAIKLGRKIRELQLTDRWTFTFRVPPGHKSRLVQALGLHDGNVIEWEQSERGMEEASVRTQAAVGTYYAARNRGETSTKSFYNTDLSNVSKQQVKKALHDITAQVQIFNVGARDNKREIRDFVEEKNGPMQIGAAFYQLTKTENKVHDGKMIAVRDKRTGKIYSGVEARNVLGLPESGTIKVVPGNHGEFEVFVQSKSVNRHLVGGTKLLYWENVGQPR